MLRGGKTTLEYAHMGMLEEIPGGHLMAAWQAAPDLEGGAEQSVYFAYGKVGASGRREWGEPHKLPHGAADKSVAGTEERPDASQRSTSLVIRTACTRVCTGYSMIKR